MDRRGNPRQVFYHDYTTAYYIPKYMKFVGAKDMPLWACRFNLEHTRTSVCLVKDLMIKEITSSGVSLEDPKKYSFLDRYWGVDEKELRIKFNNTFGVSCDDWIIIHKCKVLSTRVY